MSKYLICVGLSVSVSLFFFVVSFSCNSLKKGYSSREEMAMEFRHIPDSTKLSVYWYWINGNISKEGVTHDLEAMAKAGIGRAYIGNIGLSRLGSDSIDKEVKLFSPEWWSILRRVFKVADSLDVKIGMFNSPGWSQSGGPWVKPENSMRYLTKTTFHVEGSGILHKKLIIPDTNFQRISVLAFPTRKGIGAQMSEYLLQIRTVPYIRYRNNLVDGNTETSAVFPLLEHRKLVVYLDLIKAMTVRSLLLYPGRDSYKANIKLQVKIDGVYQTIKSFQFNRTNSNRNVGFLPYAPVVVSFPPTQGKSFRLVFSNTSGKGGLSEIKLTPKAYLDQYIDKSLAKMNQTPHPLWDAYMWNEQPISYKSSFIVNPDSVLNLTDDVTADGILNWTIPKGKWTIMQVGMVPTGVTNGPAAPDATGLEVDKMSTEALKTHFDAFIGRILKTIPEKERRAFKYVVQDSYETGSENWTDGFADDFREIYGYDPLPWLPVFSGHIVGSVSQSNRFLWDMRRIIADRVAYNYVGGLRKLSHEHGLKTWLENYGHWGFPAEFLQYGGQSDEVSGEFWTEGTLGDIELKAASSCAHIYGKKKVYAESFTAAGRPFQRYPGYLKQRGDWSFTQGINSTLLHVYIAQPRDDIKPGVNARFGTEFNRHNTWFKMGKSYFDYLRRCNYMLQQGVPVKDVAYFIGEDAPKMTGIQQPKLPKGYTYDWINAEVIENRLTVNDGKLVLPNGISYRLLVLPPQKTMRPKLLKKLKKLVRKGATILGPRPTQSPSLQNYPEADKIVETIAEELWQNCNGKDIKMVNFGKGRVLEGMSMKEAFKILKVIPDMKIRPNIPVLFTHRRIGTTDIYFICNQSDTTISIKPSFRVTGKQPEWWDAVTGNIRLLPQFDQNNRSTSIPIKLQPSQSGFVIFNNKTNLKNSSGLNFPESTFVKMLTGPWKVIFDKRNRGPLNPVMFNKLIDWSKNDQESIRYYSGTATYQKSFTLSEVPKDLVLFLDLGKVNVMAKVILNGEQVGTVWTDPYQVNITEAIKKGENNLKIKVVNTWVNRLIGDSRLSAKQRKTYAVYNPYKANSPLTPSGLLGPVKIKGIKY